MKLGEVVLWAPASQGLQRTPHFYIVLAEPPLGGVEGVLINLTDQRGRPTPYPGLAVSKGFRVYITKDSVANAGDSFLCDQNELRAALASGEAKSVAPPEQLFDTATLKTIAAACVGHPAIALEVEAEIKRQWRL
jgi:hypothetical protein